MWRRAALRAAAHAWNRFDPPRQPRDCIVVYHSVHPSRPFRTCSPDEFQRHLDWLTANVSIVPIPDLLKPRPPASVRPRVAITFDDGYADNYENAFPLLLEYQAPATFFVTAGYVERDPAVLARFQKLRRATLAELEPLTWEHLREMVAAGMDIGCHTYSHPNLQHLNSKDAEVELTRSKQILEDRLSRPILGHAYPFGKPGCTYGSREAENAERLGYRYAFTTVKRALRPGDSRWQLPRLIVGSRFALEEQVVGFWDCVGAYHERSPIWLSRAVSPRGFRASTYGGSYAEMVSQINR